MARPPARFRVGPAENPAGAMRRRRNLLMFAGFSPTMASVVPPAHGGADARPPDTVGIARSTGGRAGNVPPAATSRGAAALPPEPRVALGSARAAFPGSGTNPWAGREAAGTRGASATPYQAAGASGNEAPPVAPSVHRRYEGAGRSYNRHSRAAVWSAVASTRGASGSLGDRRRLPSGGGTNA